MIDLKSTRTGEYVVTTSVFHDYGKAGTIFRVISTEIPGEPTAAVGWMVDKDTGQVNTNQAYKIPCDKVEKLPRSALAGILKKSLKKLDLDVKKAQKARDVVEERVRNLESYYSQEQEFKDMLESVFGYISF